MAQIQPQTCCNHPVACQVLKPRLQPKASGTDPALSRMTSQSQCCLPITIEGPNSACDRLHQGLNHLLISLCFIKESRDILRLPLHFLIRMKLVQATHE